MERRSSDSRPPSMALLAREVLAFAELGVHYATMPWWGIAPRGDGCPVLVLPGLVQSDFSTRPLRRFLNNRGHVACAWGLGTNSGNARLVDDHLVERLQALCDEHGRKVSLIGWSMGGLFARNLARIAAHAVRQVITLGSPFAGHPKASNAWRLYEAMSGQRAGDPKIAARFRGALPVPATAIYSRSDGIVAWQCCLNEAGPQAENIEVISTHCGMGHHPAVLYAIADRLAQPDGQWRPFEAAAMLRWMYPARDADPSSRAPARARTSELGGERT